MAERDEAASALTGVARLVRGQICRTENTRLLRSIPAFAISPDMPSWLEELVGRLDDAEDRARS